MIMERLFSQVKVNVTNIFYSKLSLSVMLLTLVWVYIDAEQRLFSKNDDNKKQESFSKLSELSLPKANAKVTEELERLFKPYQDNDTEENDKPENVMSAEKQAEQRGQLMQFFVGENILELKAIISKEKTELSANELKEAQTVLLLVTNVKKNESVIERFTNLSIVYGYKLKVLENTQVALTKEYAQGHQKVILTMYEHKLKENKE